MNNSLNNELNYKTKKIYNCLEIHLTKTVCMSGSKSVKQTSNKRKPEICLDQILNGSINKINTVPKKFSIRNCGLNKGIAHQIRKTKEQIVPESPFIDSSIYNCKNKVFIVPETPMVNFINENNKRLVPKTPMIDFNEEPKSIFVAWENPIVNSHNGARRFIVPETPLVDFNSEKKKFY
nr:uncharacterized protein LOC105844321 isoform X3 [Hydra vulgaris]